VLEFPFTVIPRVGFSLVRFGEPRSQHREHLGEEFESWQRNPDNPAMTDLYKPSLLSLDYDDDDRLKFIEVINDGGQIVYEGIELLNQPEQRVIASLTALVGRHPVEKGGVYAFPELGIRLWCNYDGELGGYAVKGVGLVPEETNPRFTR
jgi:hypothetical protein